MFHVTTSERSNLITFGQEATKNYTKFLHPIVIAFVIDARPAQIKNHSCEQKNRSMSIIHLEKRPYKLYRFGFLSTTLILNGRLAAFSSRDHHKTSISYTCKTN